MAFSTLSSYWLSQSRKDLAERAIVSRREQEVEHEKKWNSVLRYYQDVERECEKYSALEKITSSPPKKHNETNDEKEAAFKKRKSNLEERRLKLATTIHAENALLEEELRNRKQNELQNDPWQVEKLKQEIEEIQLKRQLDQKQNQERKHNELWMYNNQLTREQNSKHLRQTVRQAWESVKFKEEMENERIRLEEEERLQREKELEKERTKLELEELENKRKSETHRYAKEVDDQVATYKKDESDANLLKQEEAELLREDQLIDRAVEKRKETVAKRKDKDLVITFTRPPKDKLRKRAQEAQQELEFDLKLLDFLVDQEKYFRNTNVEDRIRSTAREARKFLREQIKKEKDRIAEIQLLYQEEAERFWKQVEIQWEKERKERDELMNKVLEEVKTHCQERIVRNLKNQEQLLQKREETLQEIEKTKLKKDDSVADILKKEEEYKKKIESLKKPSISQSRSAFSATSFTALPW